MIVIVSGSRKICEYVVVERAIRESPFFGSITELVHGACRGVDECADAFARAEGIRRRPFPASWEEHGRSAGPIRNAEMAKYVAGKGGALVAIWDGKSRGTRNMIELALDHGLDVYVKVIGG